MMATRCTKPVGALGMEPDASAVEKTLPAMKQARISRPTPTE